MTTINHTPAGEQRGKKRLIHRFSWVSLLVCWLIWVLNAYDREMILRLGPVISKEFSLSPEQWGNIVALIMVALAVLDIPGSIWSDRYGSGWKRARFQVPLVLGYTALSFISGIKAISHGLTAFVLLRVGVNLGAGWGEPVGRQQHRGVVAEREARFCAGGASYRLSDWRAAERRGGKPGACHVWRRQLALLLPAGAARSPSR